MWGRDLLHSHPKWTEWFLTFWHIVYPQAPLNTNPLIKSSWIDFLILVWISIMDKQSYVAWYFVAYSWYQCGLNSVTVSTLGSLRMISKHNLDGIPEETSKQRQNIQSFNSLTKNFTSKFLSLKSLTQMSWDVGIVVWHHLQCNFPEMCKVNKNCTEYPVTLRRRFFGVRMGFLKIFCATCGKSLDYSTHSIVIWSFRVQYLPTCQITQFSLKSLLKLTVSQI